MSVVIPIISEFNSRGIDRAKKEFGQLETKAQKANFIIKNAALPAAAALSALGVAAFKAVGSASDLQEVTSKVGVIFGTSSKEIEAFGATAAKNLGQSKTEALNAAATFATFGSAAGLAGTDLVQFSTKFTTLASDLASFNNTSPQEAIDAIGSALRGEAEPLRKFGVLLDDATLKQAALSLGLIKTTKEALTPQNKILAAQKTIYEQTGAAQGDFERTSGGLANQQRILAAQVANVKAKMGTALLPVIETLIPLFSSLAGFVENNATLFGALTIALGLFAGAVVAARIALSAWKGVAIITEAVNWLLASSFTAVQVATGIGIATAIAGAAAFVLIKGKMDKARGAADLYAGSLTTVIENQKQLNDYVGPVATRDFTKFKDVVIDTSKAEDDAAKKKTKLSEAAKKLKEEQKKAADAARDAAEAVKKLAEELQDAKDVITVKFEVALQSLNDKLTEAKGKFDSFASSTSSAVMSAINFGNAQGDAATNVKDLNDAIADRTKAQANLDKAMKGDDTEAQAEAMRDLAAANDAVAKAQAKPMTFFDNLKKQAVKAKDFGVLVNRLIAGGISETALSQVLDAGVDAGTSIAEEILAGGQDAITGPEGVNTIVQAAQDLADKTGKLAAAKFYQAGIDQALALVAGMESVISIYKPMINAPGITAAGVTNLGAQFDAGVTAPTVDLANFDIGKLIAETDFSKFDWSSIMEGITIDVGGLATLAQGGLVTSPTIALIGEGGQPEAVVPLDRMGEMGGGNTVTINVNGGDPNAVVDALRTYMRQNGSVPIRVSNIY